MPTGKKKRQPRIVRKTAGEIPRATEAELARLRDLMNGPIDTSDISERVPGPFIVLRHPPGRR